MNRGRAVLIALGLAGLAYLLTREVVVGLLVAAAAFWLLRSRTSPRLERYTPPPNLPANPGPLRPNRSTEVHVVCRRVTAERQEWVSVKTGRIFEVLSQNGTPGAKPGDRGEVVAGSAGYRIVQRLDE